MSYTKENMIENTSIVEMLEMELDVLRKNLGNFTYSESILGGILNELDGVQILCRYDIEKIITDKKYLKRLVDSTIDDEYASIPLLGGRGKTHFSIWFSYIKQYDNAQIVTECLNRHEYRKWHSVDSFESLCDSFCNAVIEILISLLEVPNS